MQRTPPIKDSFLKKRNSMTCIVLDDEPLALKVLEHYIQQIHWLEPKGFFTNPVLARKCLDKEPIDLIILDIQMPDVTGLQFFSSLSYKPLVIFSTAFREFAVEGFELEAVDYIVKPYEFGRFQKAVQKATEYHSFMHTADSSGGNKQGKKYIFVKSAYRVVKITLKDLYLVETLDDYLQLHLISKSRPILTLMTLKSMEQLLPENRFLRVHRSYLIAIDKVESLHRKKILIEGREIPIGVTFQPKILTLFNK